MKPYQENISNRNQGIATFTTVTCDKTVTTITSLYLQYTPNTNLTRNHIQEARTQWFIARLHLQHVPGRRPQDGGQDLGPVRVAPEVLRTVG